VEDASAHEHAHHPIPQRDSGVRAPWAVRRA
jgi:hypothetical protein